MPLGDVIGEVILRPILELVLYGLTYWTGFLLLKVVTLGAIRLAPLTSIEEKNRSKRKWHQLDWSIWIHRPMHGRALKAECTCLVGMLVWVAIGFGIYFVTRDDKQTANKTNAGNGSYGICRVIDAFRSPSPDPGRSAKTP